MNNINDIMENFKEVDYRVIDLNNIQVEQASYYKFLNVRKLEEKEIEFEEKDIEKKIFPEKTLKNAKSLIIFFFPYLTKEHSFKGNLSISSNGIDYHIWVKDEMQKINTLFLEKFQKANTYIQVDNGPIDEKFFGYNSGLAALGNNALLIHGKYGSYGFLGLLVSDIKLDEFITSKKKCINCEACIKNCPGEALDIKSNINPQKCSAYITQKKGELSIEEKSKLIKSGKIYGCDICQNVCPMNKNIIYSSREDVIISNIKSGDIISFSNKEFKRKYGDRSFSWRGKKTLERNIDIFEGIKKY